jgi:hypothetical protein
MESPALITIFTERTRNPNNCQCFWQSIGAVPSSNLPQGAIPIEPFAAQRGAPKMKYPDGQEVKLGDMVALGKDQQGVVVGSIDTGEYSEIYP